MDINTAFPSNYLRAADLQGSEVKVVMAECQMEDVGSDRLPVLYFAGKEKGLVLNKTNSNTIAGIYGPDTDHWAGQSITMFATQTEFQGKAVPCIRIKLQQPAAKEEPQAAQSQDNSDIPF